MKKENSTLNVISAALLVTLLGAGMSGCNESGETSPASGGSVPSASAKSADYSLTSAPYIDYDGMNSMNMARLGLSLTDQTLGLADIVTRFSLIQTPLARADVICANEGSLAWRWVDNDNNAKISVGDTATISLKHCGILQSFYTGTVRVSFVAPIKHTDYTLAFTAKVNLLDLDFAYNYKRIVEGGFGSEVLLNNSKYNLDVSVTDEGLQYEKQYFMDTFYPEKLHQAVISRDINLLDARYRLQVNAKVSSGSLNDTFNITTGKTLEGDLNAYPDAGFLNLKSASLYARLSADNTDNSRLIFLYDKQGDGRLDAPAGGATWWSFFLDGFLFYNPLLWTMNAGEWQLKLNAGNTGLRFLGAYSLDGSYNNSPGMWYDRSATQVNSASPKLFYQFSRPISKESLSSFSLTYIPEDGFTGNQLISLRTTVEGARIAFEPLQPLLPGRYELRYSGAKVYDATNNYFTSIEPLLFNVTERALGKASASAEAARVGRLVKLNALANNLSGKPVSYQWIQTGGTKVVIQDASSAQTSFIVPSLAKPNEILSFLVLMKMEKGDTQTASTKIYAYQREDTFELLDFVSDTDDYIGRGKARSYVEGMLFSLPDARQSVTASVDVGHDYWSLDLSPVGGLKVGTFEKHFRFLGNGSVCDTTTGTLTIYDVAFKDNGQISRLAADFVQHCNGKAPALKGRIRYHTVTNM